MAGASLLALLDDISTILDDVSLLTKVAAKKTSGVLGDDLALNAQQVSGVRAERELPVVWAVAKGSLRNKAILVPAALAISAFAPWAVTPLLMVGGAFLCYEGFEKLAHKFLHSPAHDAAEHQKLVAAVADPSVDMVAAEKEKIQGAVRTDFILSAEIIAITLGTVAAEPHTTQVAVLTGIALLMTVGVYGLVAGVVKLDDAGLYLCNKPEGGGFRALERRLGRSILVAAPYLMKTLSVVGTAAMFLVGGGILTHGWPAAHHWIEHTTAALVAQVGQTPVVSPVVGAVTPLLADAVVGLLAGAIVLAVVTLVKRVMGRGGHAAAGQAD